MKSQIRSFVAITFFAAFLAAIPSMAYADQPQDGQPSQSIICSPDPKEDSLDPKPEDAPFGSGENPDTNDASAASHPKIFKKKTRDRPRNPRAATPPSPMEINPTGAQRSPMTQLPSRRSQMTANPTKATTRPTSPSPKTTANHLPKKTTAPKETAKAKQTPPNPTIPHSKRALMRS